METSSRTDVALAREVNSQICSVAESLAEQGEYHAYVFFCECGCMLPVRLSLEEYIGAGHAFASGHQAQRGLDGLACAK